jgi:hypothetical protein
VHPTAKLLADAVSEAYRRLEVAFPGQVPGARPTAIGWATVESERAEVELARALGARLGSFADAPNDILLGARCRIGPGGPASSLVVLEPTTEGRLAGSLARLGEGPVAVWFVLAPVPTHGTSAPGDGPFGPERLLAQGPRDGRHIFLLDGLPGTIPI